jgi:hypothetical protein
LFPQRQTAERDGRPRVDHRAPKGNRTLDLLLTMETLCRLSYRGGEEDSTWPPAWREIESGVRCAASPASSGGYGPRRPANENGSFQEALDLIDRAAKDLALRPFLTCQRSSPLDERGKELRHGFRTTWVLERRLHPDVIEYE